MVLSLMRRHAKSWLIKFLIGMITVVFIFYFGYSFTSRRGVKVAHVNGEPISGLEYQKTYRNLLQALQRDYKNVWSDNLIKVFDLKNKALETLINQKLLSQEARRIGLDITEKEIQDQIMANPAFQFKGRFDESRYRSLLQHNRMKPEDFEAGISHELLQQKLRQFLTAFLPVTDQEVLDHYTFSNKKVKISFVQFLPEKLKESIKFDQSSMEKYFKERGEEYRIPEKIKIAYVVINPDEFKDEVTITEKQVSDYYEDNLESFEEEKKVKARHILFKLKRDASEEEEAKLKERAISVLNQARQGKDFATLAREYSEGPSSKNGGDLGYFSSGQMVKAFDEAAFKMKKGEISDLIRTPFGYHIIKLEDIKEAKTESLEEVREQITKKMIDMASMDLAHEKALSLVDQMPYDIDLGQYAARHKVPIKQTDYFSQNEAIPDIGGHEKLRQSLFSLQKNDVSELIEYQDRFYIIQVVDKKTSYLPELNEVYDKVKKAFVAHLAMREARSAAEEYLGKLNKGKSWEELAKEAGLIPETTDFFTRNARIPKMGHDPDLQEVIFGLGKDKIYPDRVFENEKGVFVIRWEGEKGIDKEKYGVDKEKYRYSLMLAKHKEIFGDWLENLRNKAEIEIVSSPTADSG